MDVTNENVSLNISTDLTSVNSVDQSVSNDLNEDRGTDSNLDISNSDSELTKRIEQLTGEVVAKLESWPSDSEKEDDLRKVWPQLPSLSNLDSAPMENLNSTAEDSESSKMETDAAPDSVDNNTGSGTEESAKPSEDESSQKSTPVSSSTIPTYRRTSNILSLPMPMIGDESQDGDDDDDDDDAMDISPSDAEATSRTAADASSSRTADDVGASSDMVEEAEDNEKQVRLSFKVDMQWWDIFIIIYIHLKFWNELQKTKVFFILEGISSIGSKLKLLKFDLGQILYT